MLDSQTKVAIIEDELPIQLMYQFKLEREGFIVQTARNGREGFALVKNFRPDLILLDLLMPQVAGDEMLARLRAEPWGADIKVIILTNISRHEAPHALRFLHVDAYAVKAQHTPAQIVTLVHRVLGNNPG